MTGEIPSTADVVVIGGGVVGLSTALQLTRRGVRDVVVLERAQLGAGASGKSGALVRCHYTNTPEARLTHESLHIFRNWQREIGFGDPAFEATGFLQVVRPEDEDHLRANVAAHRELGIDTSVVTPSEIAEIEPLMRTDDITVAAWEPGSGYCDPNATLFGLAEAATAGGGRIFEHTPVLAIDRDSHGVTGVRTAGGTIATRTVVLAAGAWANGLLLPLGVDLGLVPCRLQVVIFRWPRAIDHGRRHRVVIDATHHSWFRPEGAAGSLIGVERTTILATPDDPIEAIDNSYIAEARAALAARFPDFKHATMRGGWSGMVMASADSHPIIDQAPGVPGLFIFSGDSGTSFKTSPAVGIALAEWVTAGAPRIMDLHPFRATRWAEGQPWRDVHRYGNRDFLTVSR